MNRTMISTLSPMTFCETIVGVSLARDKFQPSLAKIDLQMRNSLKRPRLSSQVAASGASGPFATPFPNELMLPNTLMQNKTRAEKHRIVMSRFQAFHELFTGMA